MTITGENLGETRPVDCGSIGIQIIRGPEVQDEAVFLNSIECRHQELSDVYKGLPTTDDERDDSSLLTLPEEVTVESKTKLEQKVEKYSNRLWAQYCGRTEPSESEQKAGDLTLTMYKRDIMALLSGRVGVSLDKLTKAYGSIEETVDSVTLGTAFKDVQTFVNNGYSHVGMGVLATAKA
ncbi:MAG: hypothetical protein AAB914_01160 [Patescibacteria group bacterium]